MSKLKDIIWSAIKRYKDTQDHDGDDINHETMGDFIIILEEEVNKAYIPISEVEEILSWLEGIPGNKEIIDSLEFSKVLAKVRGKLQTNIKEIE